MRSMGRFRAPATRRAVVAAILAVGTSAITVTSAGASSGWSIQATPHPAGQGNAGFGETSCPTASVCFAVGLDTNASNVTHALAERWHDGKWAVQSTPRLPADQYSDLSGVSCLSADQCTAVGQQENTAGAFATLAEHWNGVAWAVQSSPTPPGGAEASLSSVFCSSRNSCMAVGAHGSPEIAFAERWNGAAWSIVPTPRLSALEYGLGSVSCTSDIACIAAGFILQTFGGVVYTLAEQWNGTSWAVQTPPNSTGTTGSQLSGVACASPTACIAVGFYANNISDETLTEAWDGNNWSIVSSPNPVGNLGSLLASLACTSKSACLAVGYYFKTLRKLVPFSETWNGTDWVVTVLPDPKDATGTLLGGVACGSVTSCTAVGTYNNGTRMRTLAEHYVG